MIPILFALLFLLFIAFFFTRIRLVFSYKRESGDDRIKVEIGLWHGLISLRKEIRAADFRLFRGLEVKDETERGKKTWTAGESTWTIREIKSYHRQMQRLLAQIQDYGRIMKRFLRKIQVTGLKWKSVIGTGDAAETGLLSGLVWGLKGAAVMALQHFMRLTSRPQLRVEPSFAQKRFATEFECILQLRLVALFVTGLALLFNWRKGRRRGQARSVTPSHD